MGKSFISVGWVMALILTIGFFAGGYYTYDRITVSTTDREIRNCLHRVGKIGKHWSTESQLELCRDMYINQISGKYGPRSKTTIRLASMDRPFVKYRW